MYYESNMVEDILKCSFCSSKFTNVVKLIPDCGNSICGECYDKLRASVTSTNQFHCLECKTSHIMLKNGLGDNKGLLKMLQLKTKEKALNNKEKMLKSLIDRVQDKVKKLRSIDEGEEINSHCDELVKEVTEAVDSATKHLNKLGNELVEQINRFRNEALNSKKDTSPAHSNKRFKRADETSSTVNAGPKSTELESLSKEIGEFGKEWNDFFTQITKTASEEDMEKAQNQVRDFEVKIKDLESQIRGDLFNKRMLRFQLNKEFYQSNDHVGELIVEYPPSQDNVISSSSSQTKGKVRFNLNVVHTLSAHFNWVRQVLFLSNGYLASCSDDFTIKIWNPETGKMFCELKSHTKCFLSLAQLTNGWLAGGSDNHLIKIWDINERKTKRTLHGHSDAVIAMAALPNGNLASASLDDSIKIWNPCAETGQLLATMVGHGIHYSAHLKLLSNGNLVTCSSSVRGSECMIRVWSPSENKMIKGLSTLANDANVFIVLQNDKVVVSFKDGSIRLYDLDEMKSKLLIKHYRGGFFSLLELPSGHLMTGGHKFDSTIRIWNPEDGELVHTLSIGHIHCISSLSVSKDGKYLATGSYDRTVKVLTLTATQN